MGKFALYGTTSKELLSYDGAVIWHDNARELEFLFAKSISTGALEIRKLGKRLPNGQKVLPLREHPDMADVTFPLKRADFKHDVSEYNLLT